MIRHSVRSLSSNNPWRWLGAGILVLIGVAGMALLSPQLAPERPEATRPLAHFAFLYGIAFAGYVLGCRLVWGHSARAPLAWILGIGVIARLIMLPTALIQSDDVYRYIVDGHAVRAGANPFKSSPAELRADPPGWITAGGDRAATVLDSVNHPEVPTIYPPVAQLTFAVATTVAPWRVIGLRLVFCAFELTALFVALALLRACDRPMGWCLVQAWNPLIIKEIANTAHVDSVPALFILLLIPLLIDWPERRRSRRHAWTRPCALGVTLGLAILSKLYPLVLAPMCFIACARGRGPVISAGVLALTAAVTIALGYLPFLDVGVASITTGLRTYSDHWINNPGAFVLLDTLFDSARYVVPGIVLVVACAAGLALRRDERHLPAVVGACQAVLLAWLLLLPACFPWYATPLIILGSLRPTAWVVVLTGAFGLYYAALFAEFQGDLSWARALRGAEHLAVWGWLGWSGFRAFFAIRRGHG